LCKQIIDISIGASLNNAQLVNPDNMEKIEGYFSKEYLKCVLFDILLTSARYWNEDADFLSRIKTLRKYKKDYENMLENYASLINDNSNENIYLETLISFEHKQSKAFLIRSKNNLVIINPVKKTDNNILNGWDERNTQIKIQLENLYSSFNGHMSIYTINKYIKSNYIDSSCDNLTFKYILFKDLESDFKTFIINKNKNWQKEPDEESLWFVSMLPIFDGG